MKTFRSSTRWIVIVLIMAAAIVLSQTKETAVAQTTTSPASDQATSKNLGVHSARPNSDGSGGEANRGGSGDRALDSASIFVLRPVQALLLGAALLIGGGLVRRWRRASEN